MPICKGNSIPNPYEPPTQPPIPPVAKQLRPVERHASFAAAALRGVQVSLKWSSIIFGAMVLLVFVLIAGAIAYRGFFLNDWSAVLDPKEFLRSTKPLAMIFILYLFFCFTCCPVGAIIYIINHATTPKPSTVIEDS